MDGAGCRVKEDNEFTLARLELFHMKPGGVHPWHLPAPNLGHGMLVSATVLSSTTKPIYHIQGVPEKTTKSIYMPFKMD